MKNVLKTITISTIILGVIGFSLNTVFGFNTISYLSQRNINGVVMQYYDLHSYIDNIAYQFNNISVLQLTMPDLQWTNTGNIFIQMVQNLIQIAKVLIVAFNILIYPLRIMFYIIGVLLAILGFNMQNYGNNPLKWLIELVTTMESMQIPMIASSIY